MQRLLFLLFIGLSLGVQAQPKARTVITTDGEIDDVDSFIRMLLYANEFEIEGLIYSSSMWHYKGDGKGTTMTSAMEMTREMYGERTDLRWPGTNWIQELLDDYAVVYPTLSTHDKGFPTPDYLRGLVRVGNIDFEGDMAADTEGSDLIRELLLDITDERPIYLQAWGGTNTIARALKSIEDRYAGSEEWPEIRRRVSRKTIIYTIMDQDATLHEYVTPHWPDVRVLYNGGQFAVLAYPWQRMVPNALHHYLEGDFMGDDIIQNHGPLTENYYAYGDGQRQEGDPENIHGDPTKLENAQWGNFGKYDFISEGDSPAFLHLVDVGLGQLARPDYGGWGGRLIPSATIRGRHTDGPALAEYNPFTDTLDAAWPQTRWLADLQKDFAARADWCVKPYADANHPPVVDLDGPSVREVSPGERIGLKIEAIDPDGDALTGRWWRYAAAGSYGDAHGPDEEVDGEFYIVPEDLRPGETVHLILSVTDNGVPALTRYARLVLVGAPAEKIPMLTVTPTDPENGGFIVRPALPEDGRVPAGTVLTVTASPDPGYALDAIYYTVQGGMWGTTSYEDFTGEMTITVDKDMELGAVFVEKEMVENLSVTQDVVYAQPGKKPLKYDVYSPKGARNLPGIVIVHGGGWSSNNEDIMRGLARELAKGDDYVVFSIDYRWVNDLDGDNPPTSMHQLIEDVFGAIAHIQEHAAKYGTDPSRLAVTGDSAGGHLSAAAGLLSPFIGEGGFGEKPGVYEYHPTYLPKGESITEVRDRIIASVKAVAPSYGPFRAAHFRQFIRQTDQAYLDAVSPALYIPPAAERLLPHFIVRGTEDPLIPARIVQPYVDQLKAAGQPVEYLEVEGASHAFFDWKPDALTRATFAEYGMPYAAKMKAFFDGVFHD